MMNFEIKRFLKGEKRTKKKFRLSNDLFHQNIIDVYHMLSVLSIMMFLLFNFDCFYIQKKPILN